MLAYLPRSLLLWLCVKLLSCSLNILLANRFKHKERVRLMKLTIKLLVPCETMLFWSCKNDKWEFCTIEVSSIPTKATIEKFLPSELDRQRVFWYPVSNKASHGHYSS